jgi:hypothetical protein
MCNVRTLVNLILIAAIALPVAATAQKFQEPTKEELQMTSDPKAPGAPAVYLNFQQSNDNFSHYISNYARIKVLTEKGKEYSTIEVPYNPGYSALPIIEARTIHADGTVIPLEGKVADLLVNRNSFGRRSMAVFNLPSVEVGSILEYKWTIPLTGGSVSGVAPDREAYESSALASSIPEWEVQKPLFVHKAHFYYNPLSEMVIGANTGGVNTTTTHYVDGEIANYLLYSQRLPQGVSVQKSPKEDYTLDISDVPAIGHENNTPPLRGLSYRVQFYYSPYVSADVFWDNEGKRWSKNLNRFAEPTDTLRAAATQIIAGADSDEAKARKLYDAVQALDNTSFTREKSDSERQQLHLKREDKSAQDVWNAKSGSGNDLAGLYLALVRAAGLQADGMSVVDRSYRLFDAGLLSLSQLSTDLVILHLNGKDVFTDPGEKYCPFGQLHWSHTLAGGLRQTAQGTSHDGYTPNNSVKDAISSHSADITLDAQGNATGTVKVVMTGPEALHWRQLNAASDPSEVQKQFTSALQALLPAGITGELDHFQSLDNSAVPLAALVKVHGQLGAATGKRLLLPAFFFSANAHPVFVSEEQRQSPVDLHYGEQQIEDVTYHLPPGFTVESAPPANQIPWPEHAALAIQVTPGPDSIKIKRIFARVFVFLDPKEYPNLREYYQKVATSDAQQVVVTQGAA